ncbi:SPOR domain-containing protein [Methylonatrum kenyense]|uniref:SPOR domain-containing protein n=1 Tax=Methylonatrum kenyense TaxID=455253 RepID=UPI0020BFBBED|nr:SPOR domain-containing protein [Methylonatrum kenyense]MCK8517049.1 SPOR domain-containing protein [Methylonatrum kenyense]
MTRRLGATVVIILAFLMLLAGCAAPGATERGDPERFERGKQAYLDGRYSEAFELLLREAEDGNPDAQYTVGYMYYEGQGVNQDDQSALRWIRESASGGNRKAVEALGQMAGMGARQRIRGDEPEPSVPPAGDGPDHGLVPSEPPDQSATEQPLDFDHEGAVQVPPPDNAGTVTEPTLAVTGGYSVQVGTFQSRDNAEAMADLLVERDVDARIIEDDASPRGLYRVVAGPVQRREQAQQLQRQVDEIAGTQSFIISSD